MRRQRRTTNNLKFLCRGIFQITHWADSSNCCSAKVANLIQPRNLLVQSRKYKQFTRKNDSRVVIYARTSFIRSATEPMSYKFFYCRVTAQRMLGCLDSQVVFTLDFSTLVGYALGHEVDPWLQLFFFWLKHNIYAQLSEKME